MWTASYIDWGLLVVVRADEVGVRSLADLPEGARIGHYPDPSVKTALAVMARRLRTRMTTRDAPELLFDDLNQRRLDAVIYDSVFVRWRVTHDPAFRVIGEPLNKLGYQIGLRHQDAALFARIQAALKDLLASGEIGWIRLRWAGQ